MTLDGFETLYYTLAFIVPGFVLYSVYSSFVPQKTEIQFSVLRFLFFSCINYAVWSWLIYIIVVSDYSTFHPVRTAVIWGIIILISPILLGILAGYFNKKEYIRKALQRIGLNPVHVIPTGWDYKLSKLVGNSWILVTLKNGDVVAGLFGQKSFASSDSTDRDIYLEKVYKIVDDGPWEPVTNSDGILIRGEEIKHLEFWTNE